MITSKFVWDSFEKHANEIFYIDSFGNYTYNDFFQKVKHLANQNELTFERDDLVAILFDSSLESLALLFTIMFKGAIPVLLAPQTPTLQIDNLLASINCKHFLNSIDFQNFTDEIVLQNHAPQETEKATVIFTSGSTSIAKAVLHTFNNHYYSALGSNENIPIERNDRWLLSLPMHHIGGLSIIFRTLLSGSTLVGYDKSISFVDSIEKFNVTHISVVSTQLQELIRSSHKLKSLKAVLAGGGYIQDELISKADDINLPLYKTYGMSEMSSQVTTTTHDATPDEFKTSGKVLKYRELKLEDDGEILVRGEVLCKQYLNADMHIDSDGWFHTGDIGAFDLHKNLIVIGRKDNMFISGGENLYPEPLEKIILQMSTITEVCIVPKNDTKFGQVPVLFYKTINNKELLIEQVKEYLKDKVLPFQVPKELHLFPKEYNPLGIKLNRTFLKTWIQNL